MAERMVVLAAAFGIMTLFDWYLLRKKMTKQEKAVYFILLFISLYLGFDYAINKNWADIYDVINPVFGGVAKAIDDYLNVK
ncbi:hypothetical protein [Paenibacillus prosopidis]|uniref:Holin n=1 Tax=Paenibacillus prosopidis TaxID=630520 RepID=A0A368W811_9BACL|nr:hypothetical protein [Paenibacillus prosopidis]RCW48574.1 hypothetical protein DFP97_106276 [Paenibacillus prosopidis]